jgi:predicted homoserine dehydrogenase-like protein
MIDALRKRQTDGRPIRVGLIGAGAMGMGIAWQISRTPGMEVAFIGDIALEAARLAAEASGRKAVWVEAPMAPLVTAEGGGILITNDPLALLEGENGLEWDVLVEASNTIGPAARYCFAAIRRGMDIVLMNAEVDLALGPLLQAEAAKHGVIVTSDAGDQHGVLKTMIDEITLWGFGIVQAGNIKGFLKRTATAESLKHEAAKRHLSAIQCCAYTDGTKLNIEMACLANGTGLTPLVSGMEGPSADDVREVLDLFDFQKYEGKGRVDYILGAEPGGGVYVVGFCDEPVQGQYMQYYKMGSGPYYLFYRPYHLCHVETPRAIAEAVLLRRAIMTPAFGRMTDVYAYAKRDVAKGEVIEHGIGGDAFYGLIEECATADAAGSVPIALMEGEDELRAVMREDVAKGQPLRRSAIDIPETYLMQRFREQGALAGI